MASLVLTAASPIGYLEYPSVHHKESLVVGVFGQTLTLKYDLVYKVGRLDKGKLLVRWGDNHEYAKGYYPSIALIHTGVEGIEGENKQRYYVVETHQSGSGLYKTCYYRVGEVNEDLTIDFGPDSFLCYGVTPKVCAKDNGTVIIISGIYNYFEGIQYSIGQVNVKAKTIDWHTEEPREFKKLSGICPSVSISEDHVVVACVNSSKLSFIGNFATWSSGR